jgi:hypothetical protein
MDQDPSRKGEVSWLTTSWSLRLVKVSTPEILRLPLTVSPAVEKAWEVDPEILARVDKISAGIVEKTFLLPAVKGIAEVPLEDAYIVDRVNVQ